MHTRKLNDREIEVLRSHLRVRHYSDSGDLASFLGGVCVGLIVLAALGLVVMGLTGI